MESETGQPVAQVRVTIHSLTEGETEVEVAIDPEGDLRGVYGNDEERFAALQTLFDAVQRELADALDTLAAGDGGPDEGDDPDERLSLPGHS